MQSIQQQPTFILVRPQLAENIGAVARAMANFGLSQLRVINPLCNLLDEKAVATAAGAEHLLHQASVFDSIEAATADLQWLYGTCATQRHMIKEYIPLPLAMTKVMTQLAQHTVGILFGPERTGLGNDILSRCHQIIQIPVDPDFSSINLAQAVILTGYEWFKQTQDLHILLNCGETTLATQGNLQRFLDDLEQALDRANYWREPHKKPLMWQNLQNIFTRLQLTEQDLRSLRGVFQSLTRNQTK
ncbi:RNA methyltransferase [Candidatus Paracaedibacter symbiosus]|uniref:RNA methyltransferase n=1 Tax=Candidatus Paracaedibacter symbiosus TaxID=244582 RepID=UPI000509EB22|nr:RNA methyltransferase [Candidatus Paracaedibacter symbiosus]